MYCIYELIFENGSFYIGVSNNLKRRLSEHKYAFSKKTTDKIIRCVVLYDNLTESEAYQLERNILSQELLTDSLCLNQTIGGRHPVRVPGWKMSQEQKDHISRIKKGKTPNTSDEMKIIRSEKYKQTCLQKYGVDNVFKTQKLKDIVRERNKIYHPQRGQPGTMLGKTLTSAQLAKNKLHYTDTRRNISKFCTCSAIS